MYTILGTFTLINTRCTVSKSINPGTVCLSVVTAVTGQTKMIVLTGMYFLVNVTGRWHKTPLPQQFVVAVKHWQWKKKNTASTRQLRKRAEKFVGKKEKHFCVHKNSHGWYYVWFHNTQNALNGADFWWSPHVRYEYTNVMCILVLY